MKAIAVHPGTPGSIHLEDVDDLIKAEALYPGWLRKLLTTPIEGLENYEQMIRALTDDRDAIKVYVEVAGNDVAG